MANPITKDQILDDLLRREGSAYTNNPLDRGGPTKYGITLATLSQYFVRTCTEDDVKNLDEATAKAIYRKLYIDPFKGYNGWLLALLVDSAVQHGVARVQKWLTDALASKERDVYASILVTRMKFYGQIISKNPSQALFASGWMNRLSEFV